MIGDTLLHFFSSSRNPSRRVFLLLFITEQEPGGPATFILAIHLVFSSSNNPNRAHTSQLTSVSLLSTNNQYISTIITRGSFPAAHRHTHERDHEDHTTAAGSASRQAEEQHRQPLRNWVNEELRRDRSVLYGDHR